MKASLTISLQKTLSWIIHGRVSETHGRKGHGFWAEHNATWDRGQMQDGGDWAHEAANALSMQQECALADPSPTARHA